MHTEKLAQHSILTGLLCLRGGGGGGGGFTLFFVVKLDYEIAVDQQTKAHDETFEGFPDSGCPRDSHALEKLKIEFTNKITDDSTLCCVYLIIFSQE